MTFFLKSHEPTSASYKFSSAASSFLSVFTELKRVRALVWIRLWFKRLSGWFDLLSGPLNCFHVSRKTLLLIAHMFTGVAISVSYENSSFAFTKANWPERPGLGVP